MKTKKRKIRSGKRILDSGVILENTEDDLNVVIYCEACINIRKGNFYDPGKSKEDFVHHTCDKSGREIDELFFHSSIVNGIWRSVQSDL